MPTPFEAGKNAKELGIDTTRSFVLLKPFDWMINAGYLVGTIVKLTRDDMSPYPFFRKECLSNEISIGWDQLSYAEDPTPKAKEPYQPMIGDSIRFDVSVSHVEKDGGAWLSFGNHLDNIFFQPSVLGGATLLSRPTPPRKVTRAEAEKALGGPFIIEG